MSLFTAYILLFIFLCIIIGLLLLLAKSRRDLMYAKKEIHLLNAKFDKQELSFIQARIEGQEKERSRIAKDLHDRLGSMLSMIKIHYQSVEEQLETLKVSHKKQYKIANSLLDEACEEVRRIANDMNSVILSKFGLNTAIEDLILTLNNTGVVTVDLNIQGLDERIDNSIEIGIYRIIQELLNNVIKHSFSKEVSIQLLQNENTLNIIVEDNGVGFIYHVNESPGMGLKNVVSRVEKLEGEFQVDSILGNGTTIIIDIPIAKNKNSLGVITEDNDLDCIYDTHMIDEITISGDIQLTT